MFQIQKLTAIDQFQSSRLSGSESTETDKIRLLRVLEEEISSRDPKTPFGKVKYEHNSSNVIQCLAISLANEDAVFSISITFAS